MVIRRTYSRIGSRIDNQPQDSEEVVDRKIFKTWTEVLKYMNIETIDLPWDVKGTQALEALRKKYGKRFKALDDPFLDDVVDAYRDRSASDQLSALGEALQELKLRFCRLNLNPTNYTVFVVESDNTKDYLNQWKAVLTRRQFFNTIDTFSMRHDETLDNPSEDVKIPMESVQVLSNLGSRWGNEYILDGHFLVIPYETVTQDNPEPKKQLRIYDIRSWPLRELKVELSFNRENLEPYSLSLTTESGTTFHYVGDDIERARSWKKTILNDKKEYIPVYEEDDDEDDGQWKGFSIGKKTDIIPPEIEDATPLFTIDHNIIYHYDNDDVDNRLPEEENPTRASIAKRRERRRQRNTLLEYNTKTQKYRTLNLPASAYVEPEDLILYKNTWIIITDSLFNRDAAYILRLWNPKTHECFRLTQRDMGCHDVERILPTEDGDILFLLDDGRLCRLKVDLVSWLKEDMLQHKVVLDDWKNEVNRKFEDFPKPVTPFSRLRRRQTTQDRMLITFEDGKTYDILLKEVKR